MMDNPFADGYQAPPLVEFYFRERAQVYADKPWINDAMRYALAMQRDLTPLLHRHIRERRKYEGNVVLEFAGPTGFGKSSCMLSLMEQHNGLTRVVREGGVEGLRKRLGIDLQDLPHKLEGLTAGDAVCLDEQLHLVGEGSETALKTLRNLEDTLRGTMIDIYFASPAQRDDHDASQGVLQAMSVSPPILRDGQRGRMSTKFLYSLGLHGYDAIPLGLVTIPWCSAEVFAAYSVIKRENLERTKKHQFHGSGEANDQSIKKLFEVPALQARLRVNPNPTKADWRRYLKRYAPSMSIAEADMTATELEEMMTCLRQHPDAFVLIWEWEPSQAMRDAAKNKQNSKTGGTKRADPPS